MHNFQRLTDDNGSTIPLLNAVLRHPEWWNGDRARTSFEGSPHAQADDILARCCTTAGRDVSEAYVDLEAEDRPVMLQLPQAQDWALNLMRLVRGTRLGRVVFTRLAPGSRIEPHADQGLYADYYARYHVVLQGLPGSLFVCGDETVHMATGEVWWFNHRLEHSVINNSKDDRIHMIVDIRTP